MTIGLRRAVLAALMTVGMALPAHSSIVFNFSWTGDPTQDPAIVTSPDATLRAIGVVEIDAAPGAVFTNADIVSTNITVSGAGFADWSFTSWTQAGGSIAADGLSASFSAMANPHHVTSGSFFGCLDFYCESGDLRVRSGTLTYNLHYDSPESALAAMQMTAMPPIPAIPLPAGLPLLLGGLGLLAVVRRRV